MRQACSADRSSRERNLNVDRRLELAAYSRAEIRESCTDFEADGRRKMKICGGTEELRCMAC